MYSKIYNRSFDVRYFEKWVCKIEKVGSYSKLDNNFCTNWYEYSI